MFPTKTEADRHSQHGMLTLLLAAMIVCGSFTIVTTSGLADTTKRPNVIVIMADDLGYGDIGCFGNTEIRTPNLDRMAKEGIRLTDFHSSGAVCSPTRAGLMTGRYQQRAGIPSVIYADPKRETHPHGLQDREVTFPELFSQAGYKTAIFGKWHLGYYPAYNPTRHGFQTFRGYVSGNVDFFSHVDQAGRLDWWHNETIQDEPGYTTHLITDDAVEFIKTHKDQPFCLYLPYEPPHYPYQGPNDAPVRTVGKPRGAKELKQSRQDIARAYREMVEEMDRGIGEILDQLKAQNLDENTLVMFFSDNGGNQNGNNGPLRGRKGQIWEGGHRVPFIARWPGVIPAGTVSDELAISLDAMPTILSVAGIEVPQDLPLDGKNLMPILTGKSDPTERTLFWGVGNANAVRQGPWKLVKSGKQTSLYHLGEDLAEKTDRSSQEPKRVKILQTLLDQWEKDIAETRTPQPNSPPED